MFDIRKRPSVDKRRRNQTKSFVEIREQTLCHTSKTGWRLSEDSECQKKLKKYQEVCCCLRKESQAYIPIILSGKWEKKIWLPKISIQADLWQPKQNHPAIATVAEKYIGQRTVPIVHKKMPKL